jgi:hypothetical protein
MTEEFIAEHARGSEAPAPKPAAAEAEPKTGS